jgi:hypothetical protein
MHSPAQRPFTTVVSSLALTWIFFKPGVNHSLSNTCQKHTG